MSNDDPRQTEITRLQGFPSVEEDPQPEVHGVLLQDQIRYFAEKYRLIEPFEERALKPAGYELSVGEEYAVDGKVARLSWDGSVQIEPFQVVVISTEETVNLPHFLIARWNLKVSWVYEGLLWVGAPQVDPGWVGRLACPIYNLSSKSVFLKRGDRIALMDFSKTTPLPNESEVNPRYNRPPGKVRLRDYSIEHLRSALYTDAAIKVQKVRTDVDQFRGTLQRQEAKMERFIGLILAVLGILIAALSVANTQGTKELIPYSGLLITIATLAVFAFLAALSSVFQSALKSLRPILSTTAISIVVVAALCTVYFIFERMSGIDARISHIEESLTAPEAQQTKP